MRLGRIIGTVVPSIVAEELSATPFLWVQPLDREGQDEGAPLVAHVISCQRVYLVSGEGSALVVGATSELLPMGSHVSTGLAADCRNPKVTS